MNSFYSRDELLNIGFKRVGENVLISKKASIYGAENIEIGSNVRVDDFCILSGKIKIGNYIHIAAYSALYGSVAGIEIGDFANLSSRVTVYAINDDYSGETMTNPMIPEKFKNETILPVRIGKHVIIGSTSVVLPGVKIAEGGAFGSFSLIKTSTDPWTMYAGIPVRKIKERKKGLLEFEKLLREEVYV